MNKGILLLIPVVLSLLVMLSVPANALVYTQEVYLGDWVQLIVEGALAGPSNFQNVIVNQSLFFLFHSGNSNRMYVSLYNISTRTLTSNGITLTAPNITTAYYVPRGVIVNNGKVYVHGVLASPRRDSFIVRLNSNLEPEWGIIVTGRNITELETNTLNIDKIIPLQNGDMLIDGRLGHEPFIARIDQSGNVIWGEVILNPTFDYGNLVVLDVVGNVAICHLTLFNTFMNKLYGPVETTGGKGFALIDVNTGNILNYTILNSTIHVLSPVSDEITAGILDARAFKLDQNTLLVISGYNMTILSVNGTDLKIEKEYNLYWTGTPVLPTNATILDFDASFMYNGLLYMKAPFEVYTKDVYHEGLLTRSEIGMINLIIDPSSFKVINASITNSLYAVVSDGRHVYGYLSGYFKEPITDLLIKYTPQGSYYTENDITGKIGVRDDTSNMEIISTTLKTLSTTDLVLRGTVGTVTPDVSYKVVPVIAKVPVQVTKGNKSLNLLSQLDTASITGCSLGSVSNVRSQYDFDYGSILCTKAGTIFANSTITSVKEEGNKIKITLAEKGVVAISNKTAIKEIRVNNTILCKGSGCSSYYNETSGLYEFDPVEFEIILANTGANLGGVSVGESYVKSLLTISLLVIPLLLRRKLL